MINLTPPDIKKQVEFSKWNARIIRNGGAIFIAGLLLMAFLGGIHMYAQMQTEEMRASVEQLTQEADKYSEIEEKASALSDKLTSIESLLDSQRKFSVLITDIADVMPPGARLKNISLTGDEAAPLKINAETDTQIKAGILRNALITSDRFSAADIQSVAKISDEPAQYNYSVTLVLAFSEGGAE